MKIRLTIFLFIIVKLCFSQVHNFRNYTKDQGLESQYIYDISQRDDKQLCISTNAGFVTFDGYDFTTYNQEKGLNEDFVNTHLVNSDNSVYLGYYQKGLSLWNNGKINNIEAVDLEGYKITAIEQFDEEISIVATQGKGIYILQKDTCFKAKNFTFEVVYELFKLTDNKFFASTSEGLILLKIDKKDDEFTFSTEKILPFEKIVAFAKYSEDEFWMVTKEGKIWNYFLKEEKLNLVVQEYFFNEDVNVTSLVFKNKKNLWISTLGQGIFKLSFINEEHTKFKKEHYTTLNGLSTDLIQTLFVDIENNLWIGTYGKGLSVLPTQKFTIIDEKSGLFNENIHAITLAENSDLWIGNNFGLNKLKLGNNFKSTQFNTDKAFVDDKVNSLYYDEKGKVWIGTEENGLFYYDYYKNKIVNASEKYEIKSSTINSITGKKENDLIYVGTNNGLYIINTITNKVINLNTNNGGVHNLINFLYLAKNGTLWFASPGSGPYKYKDGEFTIYKNIEGLKSYNVSSICTDTNERVWFATQGDGVFSFDPEKEDFVKYTIDNGLTSNYGYTIFSDSENSIWVGHKWIK